MHIAEYSITDLKSLKAVMRLLPEQRVLTVQDRYFSSLRNELRSAVHESNRSTAATAWIAAIIDDRPIYLAHPNCDIAQIPSLAWMKAPDRPFSNTKR